MVQRFEKNITVNQFECDFKNRMKTSSVLRQVEQVSMDNCTAIGIDAALYEKTKTAFLLSRLVLEFRRDITVGESLKLVTIPSLPVRAVYNRYTVIYDDVSGEELAQIDTRWVLINTETKRIYRKPPAEFNLPFFEHPECELSFDLEKSESTEKISDESADYSRTDINGHMNNTEYADIICNHLPVGLLGEKSVKRIVIYYQNELPAGEVIKVYRAGLIKNEKFYFTGIREDGKTCFEANIELG